MGRREALQTFGDRLTLPSLPDIVMRVNTMIDDPSVGVADLGRVASQDPAVTARVLRLANSGYYGLNEQVTSAEQAVTVIGARALRNVAMQTSILKHYEHLRSVPDFDLDELWKHLTLVARLAQALGKFAAPRTGMQADDFYACGLLHDIGKVVILEGMTEEYLECMRIARRTGSTLHAAEEQVFGFTHIDVGTVLASQWQLPEKVAQAIEYHHGPSSAVLEYPHVGVIAIADQIGYRAGSDTFASATAKLGVLAQKALGITPEQFQRVLEITTGVEVDGMG